MKHQGWAFVRTLLLAVEIAYLYQHLAKQISWLRLTLIPWMNNIGNHINPQHTTLPGDM